MHGRQSLIVVDDDGRSTIAYEESQRVRPVQLSLNVGGDNPDIAVLKLSASLILHRELNKAQELHVQVVAMDGEVVADGYGVVGAVTFTDVADKYGDTHVERHHVVKIK